MSSVWFPLGILHFQHLSPPRPLTIPISHLQPLESSPFLHCSGDEKDDAEGLKLSGCSASQHRSHAAKEIGDGPW